MDFFNMTSCEINDLYKRGNLDFSSLSREELDAIFDIETSELYRNKNHSLEVLNKCSEALTKLLSEDDPQFTQFMARKITAEDLERIIATANERRKIKEKEEAAKRHISVRRAFAIAIAAALLVTVLSATCVAMFDPFSELGITIREIFNMKPDETYESDDIDLYVSDEIVYYDSYEELVEAVGFEILWFDEEATGYEVEQIYTSISNDLKAINITLSLNQTTEINYRVYYGENVLDKFDENDWTTIPNVETLKIKDNNAYLLSLDTTNENVRIVFDTDNLTESQITNIVQSFLNNNENEYITYGLTCTLLGHKLTQKEVTLEYHNYFDEAPHCKFEIYLIGVCERCDYTERTWITTEYYNCH